MGIGTAKWRRRRQGKNSRQAREVREAPRRHARGRLERKRAGGIRGSVPGMSAELWLGQQVLKRCQPESKNCPMLPGAAVQHFGSS